MAHCSFDSDSVSNQYKGFCSQITIIIPIPANDIQMNATSYYTSVHVTAEGQEWEYGVAV